MKSQFSLFKFVFSIQYRLIIVSYAMTSVFTVFLVGYIISQIFNPKFAIIAGLPVTIFSILIGVILHSIASLQQACMKFDSIKDQIALKEIKKCDEFAKVFNSFITDNFKHSIFQFKHSFIKLQIHPLEASSSTVALLLPKKIRVGIAKRCQQNTEPFCLPIEGDQELLAYVVPIYIGDRYLGYWGVLKTRSFLDKTRLVTGFMSEIENQLLDDQALNVLGNERMLIWKKFIMGADVYSDKISKGEYSDIDEYASDIIEFIVKLTGCSAGAMKTIYSHNAKWFVAESSNGFDISRHRKILEKAICSDPLILEHETSKTSFVYVLPIFIDSPTGAIYLFHKERTTLEYYKLILADLENVKLDNDLSALAQIKRFEPVANFKTTA